MKPVSQGLGHLPRVTAREGPAGLPSQGSHSPALQPTPGELRGQAAWDGHPPATGEGSRLAPQARLDQPLGPVGAAGLECRAPRTDRRADECAGGLPLRTEGGGHHTHPRWAVVDPVPGKGCRTWGQPSRALGCVPSTLCPGTAEPQECSPHVPDHPLTPKLLLGSTCPGHMPDLRPDSLSHRAGLGRCLGLGAWEAVGLGGANLGPQEARGAGTRSPQTTCGDTAGEGWRTYRVWPGGPQAPASVLGVWGPEGLSR